VTDDSLHRRHRALALDGPVSRRGFLEASARGAAALLGARSPLVSARASFAVPPVPQTLRQKVAQLFIISFRGLSAGHATLSLFNRYPFGGVILYSDNCQSAPQIRTMLAELQAAARYPLLVCTDQEGGGVVRIRNGAPSFPWEATYGSIGSTERVYRDASITALDLRNLVHAG